MTETWKWSAARRAEFDAEAVAYDTYRPRYPEQVFDTIIVTLGTTDATVVEIGAGTGIASEPLARRGLRVIANEPTIAMAEIAAAKLGADGEVVVSTFEDWQPTRPVDLVAAFTSWLGRPGGRGGEGGFHPATWWVRGADLDRGRAARPAALR
jgi:trans-aconitate methyltransferase